MGAAPGSRSGVPRQDVPKPYVPPAEDEKEEDEVPEPVKEEEKLPAWDGKPLPPEPIPEAPVIPPLK